MAETPATTVFLTLGSNIEPRVNLSRAIARLRRDLEVEAVSGVWESAPHEAPGTPDFLNAALRVRTRLAAVALKRLLRRIEADLGRRRTGDRNAPRPIDIDIALYGSRVIDELRIPDPEIASRAYLAFPLAEVGAEVAHPVTGERLAEIAAALTGGGRLPRRVAAPDTSDAACADRGEKVSSTRRHDRESTES